MRKVISCEFDMDTACVELRFSDGSMVAIDTIAVENEVADTMYHRLVCQTQICQKRNLALISSPGFKRLLKMWEYSSFGIINYQCTLFD